MKKFFLLTILSLMSVVGLNAQSVTAKIDSTQIKIGQQTKIQIQVITGARAEGRLPRLPRHDSQQGLSCRRIAAGDKEDGQ
jgi:hypothetical protein